MKNGRYRNSDAAEEWVKAWRREDTEAAQRILDDLRMLGSSSAKLIERLWDTLLGSRAVLSQQAATDALQAFGNLSDLEHRLRGELGLSKQSRETIMARVRRVTDLALGPQSR